VTVQLLVDLDQRVCEWLVAVGRLFIQHFCGKAFSQIGVPRLTREIGDVGVSL
jgi:hypothetical protein